jgi:hypothetical protein
MARDTLSDEDRTELVRTARTAVGDELRSLAHFTEDAVDQLYLRDDLDQQADLIGFAENERFGFRSQVAYSETDLGEYRFTIRVFEQGYLTRVIVDDRGVWVTTDLMEMDRFKDLASAMASVLREL